MINTESEFLSQINGKISSCLSSQNSSINQKAYLLAEEISSHLCQAPFAKRARPLLCLYYQLLFAQNFDCETINIAVAAEFIHAASLLHDDVVDKASMRRGNITANQKFGNDLAVLGGNFLLTQAFDLLRPMRRELIDRAIIVVRDMTLSAMHEICQRGELKTKIEDWFLVARGKTGALFAWCGFAAAVLNNQNAMAEKLWGLGFSIGNLFQMVDDLKDFHGDNALKEIANDIRNKELSLPIVLALASEEKEAVLLRKKYQNEIADYEVNEIKELIFKTGAIDKTKNYIRDEVKNIRNALVPLASTPGYKAIFDWLNNLASV